MVVDGLGHQFLARAGLAVDEHRGGGVGGLAGPVEDLEQLAVAADDVLEAITLVQGGSFVPPQGVGGPLQPLEVLPVGDAAHKADVLPLFGQGLDIDHGVHHLAVAGLEHRKLVGDGLPGTDALHDQAGVVVHFIDIGDVAAQDLFPVQAVHAGMAIVVENDFSGGIGDEHRLAHRVEDFVKDIQVQIIFKIKTLLEHHGHLLNLWRKVGLGIRRFSLPRGQIQLGHTMGRGAGQYARMTGMNGSPE